MFPEFRRRIRHAVYHNVSADFRLQKAEHELLRRTYRLDELCLVGFDARGEILRQRKSKWRQKKIFIEVQPLLQVVIHHQINVFVSSALKISTQPKVKPNDKGSGILRKQKRK